MGCSVEQVRPKPMLAQMQKKLVDWHLEDPNGKSKEEVRAIRDEIERRVSRTCHAIAVTLLPAFQSELASVPRRYCFMSTGFVSASPYSSRIYTKRNTTFR